MEPMRKLSLLLESSSEPTIHSTLDYFLRFLYEKLDTSPKRTCCSLCHIQHFRGHFGKKLLMFLDDVEQFFLWVMAAMLDGRRIGFD